MSNPNHKSVIAAIMAKLNKSEQLPGLLRQALNHRSWINEHHQQDSQVRQLSNERLEFLGDALLGLTISEKLYQYFPEDDEGQLSKAKAYLISAPVLADVARKLDLGHGLLLGQGELKTGGRSRDSLLANAMEAVIGAIYLALGLEATQDFILQHWQHKVQSAQDDQEAQDNKTILQEMTQKYFGQLPEYKVATTCGPDHDKQYDILVMVQGKHQGQGTGRSKKEAEQNAAAVAINTIKKQIKRTEEDK